MDDPNVQAPDNGVNPIPGPLPGLDAGMGQGVTDAATAPAAPPPQAPNTMEQAESQGSTQAPQMPQRPPGTSSLGQYQGSKSQIFRSILGDFLYSAGKGLAASGHGPEANARGAGEAISALPERDIMRQQLANQRLQAQGLAAYHQAQAGQFDTVQVPSYGADGQVEQNPDGSVKTIPIQQKDVGNYFSRSNAARMKLTGTEDTNVTKWGIAQLQTNIKSGQISKVLPATVGGKTVMQAYNKEGKVIGVLDGALPPASYLPKETDTTEYKQLDDGSIVALPKKTTSQVGVPGATAGAVSPGKVTGQATKTLTDKTGAPLLGAGASAKNAKWVSWDEDGRQVAGPVSMARANGIKEFAEVPAQEIRDITNARHAVNLMTKVGDPKQPETQGVLQLIDSLDKEGKLGVLASRWNSFMTTGVGAAPGDDTRIVTLINKNMLGDTATMLAHFGASGGRSPQMLQHFLDLANATKMDGPTLKAGILSMVDYMKDRAQVPSGKKQGGLTADDLLKKYPPIKK